MEDELNDISFFFIEKEFSHFSFYRKGHHKFQDSTEVECGSIEFDGAMIKWLPSKEEVSHSVRLLALLNES